MKTLFSKYTGCGNDFILIDDREERYSLLSQKIIANICHRHKGIGADGMILLQNSLKADFRMRIFNADGSEAEMCGNGIRCLARFIQDLGLGRPEMKVESMLRTHVVTFAKGLVSVEMGAPKDLKWHLDVAFGKTTSQMHFMDTGVPHAIEFVDNLEQLDMARRGPSVRHHTLFSPRGTNYNAVKICTPQHLQIRTFERGVEAETLACGTGATAGALVAARIHQLPAPLKVTTKSMDSLTIDFKSDGDSFKDVWMGGPAHKIYTGSVDFEVFKLNDTDFLE